MTREEELLEILTYYPTVSKRIINNRKSNIKTSSESDIYSGLVQMLDKYSDKSRKEDIKRYKAEEFLKSLNDTSSISNIKNIILSRVTDSQNQYDQDLILKQAKELRELLEYFTYQTTEAIDEFIIEANQQKRYDTFSEYDKMYNTRDIQQLLKYDVSISVGNKRIRQLKQIRQRADVLNIRTEDIPGKKFSMMNLRDLLVSTENSIYRNSIYQPIIDNYETFRIRT
jgi:Tfp pilus assembly pilus retraction ATPase PilT